MAKLPASTTPRRQSPRRLIPDPAAIVELEAVFAASRPALNRRIDQLVNDDSLAEDLTQETFLRAYEHLNTFRLGSNMRAWLFRIAANLAFDQHRRRKLPTLPLESGHSQLHAGPGPEERALSAERAVDVRQALSRLSPRARQALLLAELENMSGAELARELNTTPATIRNLLMRTRQHLRRNLRDTSIYNSE